MLLNIILSDLLLNIILSDSWGDVARVHHSLDHPYMLEAVTQKRPNRPNNK